MRLLSPQRAGLVAIAVFAAVALPASADERAQFNACKALVDGAAQPQPADAKPDEAELQRCRQIIREWTLRDSRMSVDENGRPLR
jgi:hypothetical protein